MRVIDCYIQLERARFSDRLSVTYDFSEDMLENLQIPPLLLQPLVENAVIHGVIKLGRRWYGPRRTDRA